MKQPWDIRDPSPRGDAQENDIFVAVGSALTEWKTWRSNVPSYLRFSSDLSKENLSCTSGPGVWGDYQRKEQRGNAPASCRLF